MFICVLFPFANINTLSLRTQKVAIPAVNEAGEVCKWSGLEGGRGSQTAGGGSKAIERVKNRDYDGSLYMVNKPPRWNDQVSCRCFFIAGNRVVSFSPTREP